MVSCRVRPRRARRRATASQSTQTAQTTTITVDGREAGPVSGFHVGVRSEWWITLLLLAIAITSIEWATYHRRITV